MLQHAAPARGIGVSPMFPFQPVLAGAVEEDEAAASSGRHTPSVPSVSAGPNRDLYDMLSQFLIQYPAYQCVIFICCAH
jgi:hypothetical protein